MEYFHLPPCRFIPMPNLHRNSSYYLLPTNANCPQIFSKKLHFPTNDTQILDQYSSSQIKFSTKCYSRYQIFRIYPTFYKTENSFKNFILSFSQIRQLKVFKMLYSFGQFVAWNFLPRKISLEVLKFWKNAYLSGSIQWNGLDMCTENWQILGFISTIQTRFPTRLTQRKTTKKMDWPHQRWYWSANSDSGEEHSR